MTRSENVNAQIIEIRDRINIRFSDKIRNVMKRRRTRWCTWKERHGKRIENISAMTRTEENWTTRRSQALNVKKHWMSNAAQTHPHSCSHIHKKLITSLEVFHSFHANEIQAGAGARAPVQLEIQWAPSTISWAIFVFLSLSGFDLNSWFSSSSSSSSSYFSSSLTLCFLPVPFSIFIVGINSEVHKDNNDDDGREKNAFFYSSADCVKCACVRVSAQANDIGTE